MRQQDRTAKQHENFSVGSKFQSLLEPNIADHRLFLALRNAGYRGNYRPVCSPAGRSKLHDAEDHWEDE